MDIHRSIWRLSYPQIQYYSPVDDVDIHRRIYPSVRRTRKLFEGSDVAHCISKLFFVMAFLGRKSFSFDSRSMIWPISNDLPWNSFTVTERSSSFRLLVALICIEVTNEVTYMKATLESSSFSAVDRLRLNIHKTTWHIS